MFAQPGILMTIVAFVLLLGPLVVVHELGHYLVGRWCGVKADVFSVGFGRELAGWTDRRGTRWKLSALPLGGYVQFAGDVNPASAGAPSASAGDDGMTAAERARTFNAQPLGRRALIVLAGPVTNLVCAVAIFAAFNLAYGRLVVPADIAVVAEGSSAQKAGVRVGDRVVAIDGDAIDSFTDIAAHIVPFPGSTIAMTVRRDGRERTLQVPVPGVTERDRFGNEGRIGRIGIGAPPAAAQFIRVGPVEAVRLAVGQTWEVMRLMIAGIVQIFSGERSVKELGGPIAIARLSGQQLSLGWSAFVGFAALISINLAFINLLPVPALDGGHLAFYAAEAVRRRPLGARSQEWALRAGVALVLALMVFVTINDVINLPVFGGR